jgi:hypothetical protein
MNDRDVAGLWPSFRGGRLCHYVADLDPICGEQQ